MQFTRREALKIGAAAALFPSLPAASAEIDKPIPTGFAPFDIILKGMFPGEIMAVCSPARTPLLVGRDDARLDRSSAEVLFWQMVYQQIAYHHGPETPTSRRPFVAEWHMLTNNADQFGDFTYDFHHWTKRAAETGRQMVMMNTSFLVQKEIELIKEAAVEHQVAIIFTRHVSDARLAFSPQSRHSQDHALWVGEGSKVITFESKRLA